MAGFAGWSVSPLLEPRQHHTDGSGWAAWVMFSGFSYWTVSSIALCLEPEVQRLNATIRHHLIADGELVGRALTVNLLTVGRESVCRVCLNHPRLHLWAEQHMWVGANRDELETSRRWWKIRVWAETGRAGTRAAGDALNMTSWGFWGLCCNSRAGSEWLPDLGWDKSTLCMSPAWQLQQIWGWEKKWCLCNTAVKCMPVKAIPVCFLFRDPFTPITCLTELFWSLCVSCFSQFPTTVHDQNIWLQKWSSLCTVTDFPCESFPSSKCQGWEQHISFPKP